MKNSLFYQIKLFEKYYIKGRSMKKKIFSIFGVVLTLVMLVGMFVPATPVAAQAYTPNQWNAMVVPSFIGDIVTGPLDTIHAGTSIYDFAVGSDGKTIYAVGAQAAAPATFIAKSPMAGKVWSDLALPTGYANPFKLVAVAPDNPNVVAVVDNNDRVFYSTNGGSTWADLGIPGDASEVITDIDISPARADALLGRDIVVCTQDPTLVGAADAFTITFGAAADSGTITVTAGSVLATPAAGATVAGGAVAVTITPALGAVAWTTPAGAGTILVQALASSTGSWARTTGNATAAITTDPDLDASVVATGGAFSLPDATFGDVYLVGDTTSWVNESASVGIGGIYDFYAVKCEPNWLGGRSVAAVGFAAAPHFVVIRTSPLARTLVCDFTMAVGAYTLPTDTDMAAAPVGGRASLALPGDFDSTSPLGIVGYVGWYSPGGGTQDVFRQDFATTRKLEIQADIPVHSIDFKGTIAGGTLFAGVMMSIGPFRIPWVYSSANPQVNAPTWMSTAKGPTGPADVAGGTIVVKMAPDYDTSKTAYAATGLLYWLGAGANDESSFSYSKNGGLSFNGISFIDSRIDSLDDVMPAPDNKTLFLSTTNTPSANASLWKTTAMPPAVGAWERVNLRGAPFTTTGTYIIRLSPDYLTDNTLYWCDYGGTDIQLTSMGGDIFANRTAPVAIQDVAVESKDIVYLAQTLTNSIYKSTNGAWFFSLPITAPVARVYTLTMAPTYPEKPKAGNVLVGGTMGGVALSLDGGASYIPLAAGVGGGANMQVVADKNFAANNLIYAAGSGAVGIWRYQFGVSTAWEQINTAAVATGMATESAHLYASPAAIVAGAGVQRSLYPFLPDIALLTFTSMDINGVGSTFTALPSALRAAGTATSTWLWAIDTVAPNRLMAYEDTMAKAVVTVTVPANIPTDPMTGRNLDFIISWNKVSNAIGYNVGIYTDADCTQLWIQAPFIGGTPPPYVGYVPSQALLPTWVVGNGALAANTKYYVRVFVLDETTTDAIDSPSAPPEIKVVSFTVAAGAPIEMPAAGPTLLSPTPGDMNVPLRPGFSWATMPGATAYEFILATDAALTKTIGGTPATVNTPNFQLTADLEYDTTYYYAVKVTAPAPSPQSIASFHTMAKPAPPPPPPVTIPPAPAPITPAWIWAIVIIGAILVIAVIVLIVTTRRTP